MDGSYHVYMLLLISLDGAIQEAAVAAFLLDVVAAAALLFFLAKWEETIILIKEEEMRNVHICRVSFRLVFDYMI